MRSIVAAVLVVASCTKKAPPSPPPPREIHVTDLVTEASAPDPYLHDVEEIAVVDSTACARTKDGRVACWGRSLEGAMVAPNPTFVQGIHGASGLALGSTHACIIDAARTVQCWGTNYMGQLGRADYDDAEPLIYHPIGAVSGPLIARQIAAGSIHTCALTENDDELCWGSTMMGESGLLLGHDGKGNWMPVTKPHRVMSDRAAIFAEGNTTCGRGKDGTTSCVGDLHEGPITMATAFSTRPRVFPAGMHVRELAPGDYVHGCFLPDGPGVLCWGWNEMGQLGAKTPVAKGIYVKPTPVPELGASILRAVAVGTETSCVVDDQGQVTCTGNVAFESALFRAPRPAASHIPFDEKVVAIAIGDTVGCALLESRHVECWGQNRNGELGIGTKSPATKPVLVMDASTPS